MGGDGGVIASNRRYMRGAGTADCTADHPQRNRQHHPDGPAHDAARELMTTCALTKAPLEFGKQSIVACPYGFLYHKEAAVQALLRRREALKRQPQQSTQQVDELGEHIRGLKDLYPVHFHFIQRSTSSQGEFDSRSVHSSNELVPACPVTGDELNGSSCALLLLPTEKNGPDNDLNVNVVSERALKEMGMDSLQIEYGPFDPNNMIRLAPLPSMIESLREKLQKRRELEESTKKNSKKKGKKRPNEQQQNLVTTTTNSAAKEPAIKIHKTDSRTEQVAQIARDRAVSAVQKSEVLSSLFTPKNRT